MGISIVFATQLIPYLRLTAEVQASEQERVFRILAVEATLSNESRSISGQLLISNFVRNFAGDNETDVYYIHLLSGYNESEITSLRPELANCWVGNSTKANVKYECENYLASASPGEIVIFYCHAHGYQAIEAVRLHELVTSTELKQWLKSVVPEAHLIVIIDSCYSGSWIDDGAGSAFGQGKMVLCSSRSDQLSWNVGGQYGFGDFTGEENCTFNDPRQPERPLGIIGGTLAANDSNRDGWASFSEIFEYAKITTAEIVEIVFRGDKTQTAVMFNGIGFDIPFVRLTLPTVSFTYSPSSQVANQTITFNASASRSQYGNIAYQWDFGDGNITTVADPIIRHVYRSVNNYTVTLNITDTRNLTNATEAIIDVTRWLADLDQNGKVNILDVTTVAKAYRSRPGDLRWNELADIDKNDVIDILDITKVAVDYGKTV